MAKPKPKADQDPADKAFMGGVAIVRAHPLLSGLAYHAIMDRGEPGNPMARDAWVMVDGSGFILGHPTRRGTPEEWAYVLAHALLHLGFGHFSGPRLGAERTHQPAWNAACCVVVARFLADLKVGRPPGEVVSHPDAGGASEDKIYQGFLERGIPPGAAACGTAGTQLDMVERVPGGSHRWGGGYDWERALADGLARAVQLAVETAAGVNATTGRLSTETRRAHEWLLSSYPLLAAMAAGFTIIEDAAVCNRLGVSIAAVQPEAREIYINPAAGLSEDELRFVLAHEMLHAGLRHDVRREGRDAYLWNIACDYIINGWLVEMRVGSLPGVGALHDPSLAGESAETLYDRIVRDARTYRKLGTFRGYGMGDILEPNPGWWNREDGIPLDEFYRRALAQGLDYHLASGRGFLPADMIEEIRAMEMRPIPWDVKLARWFDEFFPLPEKRRSYARPSRRQGANPDIPMPRYWTPEVPIDARTFGVVLDTSGSMDRALLARALGAIGSYALAREVPAARVVFCDAAPYDQGYMAPDEILGRVQVRGRGGTVLQPGIDLLETAKDFPVDGPILVITDGACDKFHVHREHAVLIPGGASLPMAPRGPVFRIDA